MNIKYWHYEIIVFWVGFEIAMSLVIVLVV